MRIVGQSVIGPGESERWLTPFLGQMLALCDEVVVCLCNADAETKAVVRSHVEITCYEDNREWGLYQNRIKENLTKKTVTLKPDWILSLDADEFLEERLTREQLEELAHTPYDISYFFWCIELWDSPDQYRTDLTFDDIRYFKNVPLGIQFRGTPLHCGMAPEWAYRWGTHSGFFFRHCGLMRKEDRERKVARYEKYDPKARWLSKEWYESLKHKAPPLEQFSPEKFIKENPVTYYRKKPISKLMPYEPGKNNKMIGSNRKDGRSWKFLHPRTNRVYQVETEKGYLEALGKKHVFMGEESAFSMGEAPVVEVVHDSGEVPKEVPVEVLKDPEPDLPTVSVDVSLRCFNCEFTGKSKRSIDVHRWRMHKDKVQL